MKSNLTVGTSWPVDGFVQEQAAHTAAVFLFVTMHVGHSQLSEDF